MRETTKSYFNSKTLLALFSALLVGLSPALGSMVNGVTLANSGTIAAVLPLQVEGNTIRNSANKTVVLRGVDYSRFIDGPTGDWIIPSGEIEWGTWDPTAAGQNLDAVKSWGCNVVRTLASCEWWIRNPNGFRNNIMTWIELAGIRGIYIVFTFWRINGTEIQPIFPYPPYDSGNNVINSTSDFVNMWGSVANTLKGFPNVIFELWNEPGQSGSGAINDEALWFNVSQQCINAIRATGATNLIVADWSGVAIDFGNYFQGGTFQTMDWVIDYPLNDSAGNLVFTAHIYRAAFYNATDNFAQAYSYSDMLWALNMTKVLSIASLHPVWMGEIGCRLWGGDTNEYIWFNNTLTIFDQYGIGYAGWWWWDMGTQLQLLNGMANYQPSQAGEILIQHMGGSI